jgi:hypothetical protein
VITQFEDQSSRSSPGCGVGGYSDTGSQAMYHVWLLMTNSKRTLGAPVKHLTQTDERCGAKPGGIPWNLDAYIASFYWITFLKMQKKMLKQSIGSQETTTRGTKNIL